MKSFENVNNVSIEPETPKPDIVWPFSVWEVERGHTTDVSEEDLRLSPEDDLEIDIDEIFYK